MEDKDRNFLPIGDNGKTVSTDYAFEDYGDDIMPKISKMPKLDLIIKHYSQYDPELIDLSQSGCTVMAGINSYATICNRDFNMVEKRDIYKLAIEKGFVPGGPRSRSEGFNTVRTWLNKNDPQYSSLLFTVEIFSDERWAYIKKLGIVGTSIIVDSEYWKDARDNLVIDGDSFVHTQGHATNMMLSDKFFCIDSIPRKNTVSGWKIPMQYIRGDEAKLRKIRANTNIRPDCHIIILDKWIKEIDPVERARLEQMKVELKKAIETNSAIWNLTTQESEKKVRNEQNNYNRGKLAIVESMLK